MSESATPAVVEPVLPEPVKVPEKSPEQILAEKQEAYQLELTLLKVRLEEAQEARDLAQVRYDSALEVTSSFGKARLELERLIRDQAKKTLADFDAEVSEKKKIKAETSIQLREKEAILLDLANAWDRVKGDWIDPNPPEESAVGGSQSAVDPASTVPGGEGLDTFNTGTDTLAGGGGTTLEDGPGAAFGSTASDDTGVVEDGDDDEDVGEDTVAGGDAPTRVDAPVEGETGAHKAGIPQKRSKRKH